MKTNLLFLLAMFVALSVMLTPFVGVRGALVISFFGTCLCGPQTLDALEDIDS